MEETILTVVGTETIHLGTLTRIFEEVGKIENLSLIGCKDHTETLTKKIIEFYIVTRGEFIADSYNKNTDARKKLLRQFKKRSKQ